MKTPSLPSGTCVLGCLCLLLTLGSCDIFLEDSKCGTHFTRTIEVVTKHNDPGIDRKTDRTYIRADRLTTRLEGNTRRFFYQTEVTGACTHEHAKATFTASMKVSSQLEVDVTARADWGLLYGSEMPLTQRTSELGGAPWRFWESSEMDIGLKQVYGDGPGLYVVRFDITFPTLGDEDRDKQWLEDSFHYSSILETNYYAHKE